MQDSISIAGSSQPSSPAMPLTHLLTWLLTPPPHDWLHMPHDDHWSRDATDAVNAVEVVAVAAELALDAVDANATPGDHYLAARHAALGPLRPVVPCRAVLCEN